MHTAALIVGGLIVTILSYFTLYQYRLQKAVEKYRAAEKEGKRPVIILSTFWFTFIEDWGNYRVPSWIKCVGYMSHKGMGGVVFHRFLDE